MEKPPGLWKTLPKYINIELGNDKGAGDMKKIFLLGIPVIVFLSLGVLFFVTNFQEVDSESYGDLHVDISKDEINIYIKDGEDKYIGYHMIHDKKKLNKKKVASNYDVWSLDGASQYTRNQYGRFKENLELVTTGEWELAIREEGANDFFGGNAHGDEIMTLIEVIIDGDEVDLNNRENYEANDIRIITTSELYRDNTITEEPELAGYHFKEYTFNKDGLNLNQKVEFVKSLTIDVAYLGMIPTLRESGKTQITDTYKIDDDPTEYDVSYEDGKLGDPLEGNKVTIYGEDSNVVVSMEILDKKTNIPSRVLVWNNSRYNKMYFIYASDGYQTEPGEVWGQTTKYDILVDD